MNTFTRKLRSFLFIVTCLFAFKQSEAQIILQQPFDASTIAATGWTTSTYGSAYTSIYNWTTSLSTLSFPSISPYQGASCAGIDNWDMECTTNGACGSYLISPAMNLSSYSSGFASLSFWFYKYTGQYGYDSLGVYFNTSPSITGATFVAPDLCEYASYAPTVSTSGWYRYTFTIPASFNTSSSVYIILKDASWFGYDVFVDSLNVQWVSTICSGAPQACTITNPAIPTQCGGYSTTLNGSYPGFATVKYQWQQSTNGGATWTNIPGATGTAPGTISYTTPVLYGPNEFRIVDTCTQVVPAQVSYSNVYSINTSVNTIPYIQNFDFASNPGLVNYQIPACMQRNGFGSGSAPIQIFSESFDATTWPPNTPGYGTWTNYFNGSTSSGPWERCATTTGCYYEPNTMVPGAQHSGAGSAYVPNFGEPCDYFDLVTPAINLANYPNAQTVTVSYWLYKWSGTYSSCTCAGCLGNIDELSVYASTSNAYSFNSSNVVRIGNDNEYTAPYTNYGTSESTTGWYQFTYTIPASFYNGNVYIHFKDSSMYGYDMYIDDVSVQYVPYPSQWGQVGLNMYHCADNTVLPFCVYAGDTSGNSSGKQDYICTPAIPLIQGITYRTRFGYARGASNWTNNTGTPPNNENLYLTVGQNNPGTTSLTSPVSGFANPYIVWSTQITSNPYVPTTANYITYTAPNTGSYYFTWIDNTPHYGAVTTANGTVALDSIRIDSVGCTLANIVTQPAATTSVCVGFPASFSVVGGGYGLTYQWYFNGTAIPGATASSYTISSATLANAGNYTVQISGTCGGPNSVTSNNAALIVNVSPPAIVTAGSSTTICPGASVALNASTGTGYTYQWYNGGGPISGATAATYNAGLANSYYVVVTSPNTCYTTSSNTTVTVLPTAPAVATPVGSTTLCQGNCVTLNASTTAGATYQWNLNGAPIPSATNPSYQACVAGTYTVTVTNTNGCPATSPVTVPVTVNPLPAAIVSSSGPDTFCQNGSVALTASLSSGVTYQWYNGSTALNNQNTNTYVATQTGVYTIQVTNTTTGCVATSVATDVLLNVPAATVTAPSTSLCSGNSVTLSANTGNNLSYQWNVNGYPISGANSSTYTTNNPGNYTVTVTSTAGSYSCSNTSIPPVTLQSYSPPPAFITTTSATTFCAGNTIILDADTGTGYTYQWILNGVNIPQSTIPTLSVASSGNYSVKVTNSQGCSATSPATVVTVVALPTPVVTASGNTQLCPGGNVSLSTPTAPGLTYQWYNGNTAIPGATFPVYVTSATANYTVVVTNGTGCQGTSNAIAVMMNPNPSSAITASGPTSICSGANVTLSAPVIGGYTYQWDLNGAPISGATSSNYQASAAGNYTVTVTNPGPGCISTSSPATNVVVFPLPSATSTSQGPTSVCNGSSVVLVANSGTGLSYQWNKSGVAIPTAIHITDTVLVSGSYTVTVTDVHGCSATSAANMVTVYSIPNAGLIPPSDTGFCQGGSVLLTAVSGSGYGYQWKKNGTDIPGATSQTYLATQAGTYTVVVNNSICSDESPSKVVSVYPTPIDTMALLGADTICYNDSVKIQAVMGNGFIYQWSENGSPIAGATQSYVWAQSAGTYTTEVTNNFGCTVITQGIQVNNFPPPNPGIVANGLTLETGAFVSYQWYRGGIAASNMIAGATNSSYTATQSGDYYVHVIDIHGCGEFSQVYTIGTTGVAQPGGVTGDVKIYPNPATSIVNIESSVKMRITVSSIEGKLLMEENGVNQIDISNLANGVYMLSVYDEAGNLLKVDRLLKAGQ